METTRQPERSNEDQRRLAHDIRNSLSVIYSYAQLLEMNLAGLALEKETKLANSVTDEIRKLIAMIAERMDSGGPSGNSSS